jgi:3-deoxy-manno-octulosonate cytidylyltransferase (CMP-KDO synthetase)
VVQLVGDRGAAAGVFDRILVATDDARIEGVARRFGAEVVRTGAAPSGTHRVALAVGDARPDVVVNVQGDQPLLDPDHLRALVGTTHEHAIATAMAPFGGGVDPGEAVVRVIPAADGRAADFRRSGPARWVHVGLYAFWGDALRCAVAAPRTERTRRADLEQLAWMDAGLPIHLVPVDRCPPGVDTSAQLEQVRALLRAPPDRAM